MSAAQATKKFWEEVWRNTFTKGFLHKKDPLKKYKFRDPPFGKGVSEPLPKLFDSTLRVAPFLLVVLFKKFWEEAWRNPFYKRVSPQQKEIL